MNSIEQFEQYLKNRESLGIKPGLERMHHLLMELGHPEREIKTIHVAGTNGKGSTIQMIADALIANEYRVGVFTSPSLTDITGHFHVNNESIQEDDLLVLVNRVLPIVEKLDERGDAPTEFEIITALAFLYFQKGTDIAIIETGMGGKDDTTNVMTPIVSVITSVALDHEQFLGATITDIARHKAGIIKPNRPVIVGPVSEVVRRVVTTEAKGKSAPIYLYGRQFSASGTEGKVEWQGPKNERLTVSLQLAGNHQVENATVALMVLSYLQEELDYCIDWPTVQRALQNVTLHGRFERLTQSPTVIIDSAHNIAGIKAFIRIAEKTTKPTEARILFAGFRDKRLDDMIDLLEAKFPTVTLTTFDHKRAAKEANFTHRLTNLKTTTFTPNWQAEIRKFLTNAAENETLFITGSLHFVTLTRRYLNDYIHSQDCF